MGILGRKIGVRMADCVEEWSQRPEVRRMYERQRAAHELAGLARAIAGGGSTDEQARDALRGRLPADDPLVTAAIRDLAAGRTGYLDDRGYRLLTAAALRTPVRPIDPDVRERFDAERALGRSSLTEAFERLAATEPRLRADAVCRWKSYEQTTQAVREGRRPPKDPRGRPTLTGEHAEGGDPVLRSQLADLVASEYAIVTRGGRIADDDPTPFFERSLHVRIATVVCGTDERPRARN